MRRWLWILGVTGLVAAISFPLARRYAQVFEIECVRPSPEQFHCVLQSTMHDETQTHVVDQRSFRGADVAVQTHVDTDGMADHTYRLRVKVDDGKGRGAITSAAGGRDAHQASANRLNRFAAAPGERSLQVRFANGSDLFWMAVINTLTAAVLTWFITRKS